MAPSSDAEYTEKLKAVAAAIARVEPPGDFLVSGSRDTFPPPGLAIDGLGAIALPLDAQTATNVVAKCHLAPYGHGDKTAADTQVRNTWELSPSEFQVENPAWQRFVDELVTSFRDRMGIRSDALVQAKLYKMLLYETDGKFERHQDSEKESGMFGTLVVMLPSQFRGGELIVYDPSSSSRVTSSSKTWDPSSESVFGIKFAAFYGDCPREVKPVTEGYRLCLTYNLIAVQDATVEMPRFKGDCCGYLALKDALTNYFKPDDASQERSKQRRLDEDGAKSPSGFDITNPDASAETKFVYVLSHQYTNDALSASNLKSKDVLVAESLRGFCESTQGALEVFLVRIKHHLTWHGESNTTYDDEEEELGEDEYIDVWVTLLNPWVPFRGRYCPIEQQEMISLFDPSEGAEEDNVEVDSESEVAPLGALNRSFHHEHIKYVPYTGNEGAEETKWYKTAAIVVVPTRLRWKWHLQRDGKAALVRWIDLALQNAAEAHKVASRFPSFRLDWSKMTADDDVLVNALAKLPTVDAVKEVLSACACLGFEPRLRHVVSAFDWAAVVQMVVDVMEAWAKTPLVWEEIEAICRDAEPGQVALVVSVLDGEQDPAKTKLLLGAVSFRRLSRSAVSAQKQSVAAVLTESFAKLLRLAYAVSVEAVEAVVNKVDTCDLVRVAIPALRSVVESYGASCPRDLQALASRMVTRLESELDAIFNRCYAKLKLDCTHKKPPPCAACDKLVTFLKSTEKTLALAKGEALHASETAKKLYTKDEWIPFKKTASGEFVAKKTYENDRYKAALGELQALRTLVASVG